MNGVTQKSATQPFPPFSTIPGVEAEPSTAVVFATCLERRAAWTHAMGVRGYIPVPVTTPLEAIFELTRGIVDVTVVDGSREAFRLDALGLVRLLLEENLSRVIIIDQRLRAELPHALRQDPRLRILSAHPPVSGGVEEVPTMRHIVLAEDDDTLRRALSRRLRRHGFKVTEVEDGGAVAGIINTGVEIDLVVSDVRMPKIEGPAALHALTTRSPDVPVILMTAFPSDDVYRAAQHLGARAVLEKPVSMRHLVDTIESVSLAA
jgi:CheY-like chemotaxis protein